jgi:hypothetical protein
MGGSGRRGRRDIKVNSNQNVNMAIDVHHHGGGSRR